MWYAFSGDNSSGMVDARSKQVAWVQAILDHNRWSQTELARQAGLDPSMLSRFLRETTPGSRLNTHTIEAIERVGGITAFETEAPAAPRGFSESEAMPFNPAGDPLAGAVSAIRAGRNGVDAWVMKSRALEHAGVMPGDVLVVDLNGLPRDGDLVCAQVYNFQRGTAETVLRRFQPPYLLVRSTDPRIDPKPLYVDGERVVIVGVVIRSMRERAA